MKIKPLSNPLAANLCREIGIPYRPEKIGKLNHLHMGHVMWGKFDPCLNDQFVLDHLEYITEVTEIRATPGITKTTTFLLSGKTTPKFRYSYDQNN